VDKCAFHSSKITTDETRTYDYFKAMGCVDERGIPQFANYIKELSQGLTKEDFLYLTEGLGRYFLELGPGLGMYIPLLLSGGGRYIGVESADFAVEWIRSTFYVPCIKQDVETMPDDIRYDCVIAAHILEHVWDAPGLIKKMFKIARERVYIIVPDDLDPVNPDHKWFFTKDSLILSLKRAGFKNVRVAVQKIVPQENFMYAVAEK